MKHALLAAAAFAVLAVASAANAATINPGDTLTGNAILGTASVYNIFGNPGNPGGDYGPDSPASLFQFTAGPGLKFNFSATGLVSCCGGGGDIPPDGGGGSMNIGGANGLSGLSGNLHIPLVGVFTTDVDPSAGIAPASLSFDVNNPLSLSPLLNQVFYIGDGHDDYNDLGAALLDFFAPAGATRLYLGVIDGNGFGGTTGYYNDNKGSFDVTVSLTQLRQPGGPSGVPEPFTLSLFGAGFAGAAALRRKNRSK